MTILIDLDSTITNFGKVLLRTLNRQYKTNHSYDEITSWDWFDKTFENPWECTRYAKFWDEVEPYPNAIETIEEFVDRRGHNIYIVTASHFTASLGYKIKRTLSWFNPILINEDNIIITSQKGQIKGDILIDDGLHNLYEFDGIGIVYNQPWNRGNHQFRRVHDWLEVKDTINNLTMFHY